MERPISQMNSGGFIRLGGFAAFGFAALIVLTNVIVVPAGLPLTGAGLDQVEKFYRGNVDTVGVSSLGTPAAWVLATLFGAAVVAALRRGKEENWSLVGFAGLMLQNVAFAIIIATRLGLTLTNHDKSALAALSALHDCLFTLNGTFLSIALLGFSIAGIRAKLIQRWHAMLGLISSGLLFLSATLTPFIIEKTGPLGFLGLVGWLLWVMWILIYGLRLIRFGRVP
jgi:hypothetical protein